MSMEGSNVGNAVMANAIENWDDDNAFDFSSISAEGDNLRPSLNADLSAGFPTQTATLIVKGIGIILYKAPIWKGSH